MIELPFYDRAEAGAATAQLLMHWSNSTHAIVLGLPRGGVPVAAEIARLLNLPLEVFLVRKLGVPRHEELAFGAIASGGTRVLNHDLIRYLGLSMHTIDEVTARESEELRRRELIYRRGAEPLSLTGRVAILVDDGLATGATMLAAVRAVKAAGAAQSVVAVPVASGEAVRLVRSEADEVVCAAVPNDFRAVGQWYVEFEQVTDDEVRALCVHPSGRA